MPPVQKWNSKQQSSDTFILTLLYFIFFHSIIPGATAITDITVLTIY